MDSASGAVEDVTWPLRRRHNAVRVACGLGPLAACPRLAALARRRCLWRSEWASVDRIDLAVLWDGVAASAEASVRLVEPTVGAVGANTAVGPRSPEDALAAWLGASTSATAVLDPGFDRMGAARVGEIWCAIYAGGGTAMVASLRLPTPAASGRAAKRPPDGRPAGEPPDKPWATPLRLPPLGPPMSAAA